MQEENLRSLYFTYAPSNRAKCKTCSNIIPKGAAKASKFANSRFHDGVDAISTCLECAPPKLYGNNKIMSTDQFVWFHGMRHADKVAILAHYEIEADPGDEAGNAEMWELADKLSTLTKKAAGEVCSHNELFVPEAPHKALVKMTVLNCRLADAMIKGLLPDCPQCKMQGSLVAFGGAERVECTGFVGELMCLSRC
jgi:hypothetical protein